MKVWYCSTASRSHKAASAGWSDRRQPGASQRARPAAGVAVVLGGRVARAWQPLPFTSQRAQPAAGVAVVLGGRVARAWQPPAIHLRLAANSQSQCGLLGSPNAPGVLRCAIKLERGYDLPA